MFAYHFYFLCKYKLTERLWAQSQISKFDNILDFLATKLIILEYLSRPKFVLSSCKRLRKIYRYICNMKKMLFLTYYLLNVSQMVQMIHKINYINTYTVHVIFPYRTDNQNNASVFEWFGFFKFSWLIK